MENASKALLMAAKVFIGVMLLILMIFLYITMSSWGRNVQSNIDIKEISEFNAQFTVYDGRSDLTAQDVVSIINLAKNYNEKYEGINFKIDVIKKGNFPSSHVISSDLLNLDTDKFLRECSLKPDSTNPSNITPYLYNCNIPEDGYGNVSLVSKIEIKCIN